MKKEGFSTVTLLVKGFTAERNCQRCLFADIIFQSEGIVN